MRKIENYMKGGLNNMKNEKNKRITKTVTFRVDEKTIAMIEGLYQTKKFKSKGEIIDIAIDNMLGHGVFKECLKGSKTLLESLHSIMIECNNMLDNISEISDDKKNS